MNSRENKFLIVLGALFFTVIVACLAGILLGYPTKWLWNWLMPELFSFPRIGFWQAFGLCVLFRFLLGTRSANNEKKEG